MGKASEIIGSVVLICIFLGGIARCYQAYREYLKLKDQPGKKDTQP